VVNKEVGSWKLGVRIKQQIKNPFKSALICVHLLGAVVGFWLLNSFSVVFVVNKEVGSWKLGVRIKQQIKNPFKSALICVHLLGAVVGFWLLNSFSVSSVVKSCCYYLTKTIFFVSLKSFAVIV